MDIVAGHLEKEDKDRLVGLPIPFEMNHLDELPVCAICGHIVTPGHEH